MKLLPLLFLLSFAVQRAWAVPQCNVFNGPSGVTECVKLSGYFGYQWATCLTNAYIQQKSNHRHICNYRFARYCWYQCMIEVHGKSFGRVSSGCSCTPGRSTATPYTGNPTTSLPPDCFSPSGDSCDWFRNCLERKYPCEDTSNAYAIRYAEKFCRLYGDRSSIFSPEGRKWVNATRKCLQVSLVPILRPWYKLSCKDIRQRAFASHTQCYLNPDKNVPSICDLTCKEFFKIFWAIKGSFLQLDTAWETLKGMWNIGSRCGAASQIPKCFKEDEVTKNAMKISKIVVKKSKKLLNRNKRSSSDPLPEADSRSRFAERVGSAIAKAFNWNTDAMDWLTYSENAAYTNDPDTLNIIIVLADIKALGIVKTSAPIINFNQTIKEFASAVANGTLALQVDGLNVTVKSLVSCSDKSCESTRIPGVSNKPPFVRITPSISLKGSSSIRITPSISLKVGSSIGITHDIHLKSISSGRITHSNLELCGLTAALIIFLNKLAFFRLKQYTLMCV